MQLTKHRSPESRVGVLAAFTPLIPIGLLWTGWSAQTHTYWVVTELGSIPIGLGIMASSLFGQLYMVDSYTKYAASAVAASIFLRSVIGAIIPIASGPLYSRLGFGWGNTVLAAISLISVVSAVVLFKFGEHLRAQFPFENGDKPLREEGSN